MGSSTVRTPLDSDRLESTIGWIRNGGIAIVLILALVHVGLEWGAAESPGQGPASTTPESTAESSADVGSKATGEAGKPEPTGLRSAPVRFAKEQLPWWIVRLGLAHMLFLTLITLMFVQKGNPYQLNNIELGRLHAMAGYLHTLIGALGAISVGALGVARGAPSDEALGAMLFYVGLALSTSIVGWWAGSEFQRSSRGATQTEKPEEKAEAASCASPRSQAALAELEELKTLLSGLHAKLDAEASATATCCEKNEAHLATMRRDLDALWRRVRAEGRRSRVHASRERARAVAQMRQALREHTEDARRACAEKMERIQRDFEATTRHQSRKFQKAMKACVKILKEAADILSGMRSRGQGPENE